MSVFSWHKRKNTFSDIYPISVSEQKTRNASPFLSATPNFPFSSHEILCNSRHCSSFSYVRKHSQNWKNMHAITQETNVTLSCQTQKIATCWLHLVWYGCWKQHTLTRRPATIPNRFGGCIASCCLCCSCMIVTEHMEAFTYLCYSVRTNINFIVTHKKCTCE